MESVFQKQIVLRVIALSFQQCLAVSHQLVNHMTQTYNWYDLDIIFVSC